MDAGNYPPNFDLWSEDARQAYIAVEARARKAENALKLRASQNPTPSRQDIQHQLHYATRIQDSMSDAVFTIDMNFNIQSWNKAAETIYGWKAEEVLGKKGPEVVQTRFETEAERQQSVDDLLNQGWWQSNVIQKRKDGSDIHIHASVSIIKDESGGSLGIVAVNRDNTKWRLLENNLRHKNEMLSRAEGIAHLGSIECNAVKNEAVWSDEVFHIVGLKPEDYDGVFKLDEYFKFIHPDDIERVQTLHHQRLQNKEPMVDEYRIVQADGTIRWVYSEGYPVIDEAGNVIGYNSILQDITARKNSDRALQSIYKTALDFSTELDPQTLGQQILENAIQVFDADRGGGIYLYAPETHMFHLVHGAGINASRIGRAVPADQGLVGEVLRTKQPVIVNNYNRWDKRINTQILTPASAVLGVPLWIQDQIIGVLGIFATSERRTFTAADTRLAEIFAIYSGKAIENARLYQHAQQEIQERKIIAEKLKKQEAYYRLVISVMVEGIIIHDANGVVVDANESALRILGLTHEQLLGQASVDPQWHTIHEDGSPLPVEDYPVMTTLRTGQAQYNAIMGIHKPDTTITWISVNAVPVALDESSQQYGAVASFYEITELKESLEALREREERFHSTIASMDDLVFVIDKEGIFQEYYQPKHASLYTSPDNFISKSYKEVLPPHVVTLVTSAIETAQVTGIVQQFDYMLPIENDLRWFSAKASIRRDSTGGFNGLTVVVRDITSRKHAELQLQESEERFSKAFRNSPVPMVITTTNPKASYYIEVNEAYQRLVGYTWRELAGHTLEEMRVAIPNAHHTRRLTLLEQVGQYRMQHAQIRHKSGAVRDVLISAQRISIGETEYDIELILDLTDQLRAEKAEQEQRTLAGALTDTVIALNTTLDLDEVLDRILTNIQKVIRHDRANIMLIDNDIAHIVGQRGYTPEDAADLQTLRFVIDKTPRLQRMLHTREPMILSNEEEAGRIIEIGNVGSNLTFYIGIPISFGDEIIGFLNLDSSGRHLHSESYRQQLQAFAHYAGIALHNAQLHQQARTLATLEERQRLARELHDAVSQTLFSASIISESLPRIWDQSPAEIPDLLQELHQMTRGALAEMRTLLIELRPAALTETPFSTLIKQLTEAIVTRARLKVDLAISENGKLPQDVHIGLYRIIQEVLSNITKHARASQVIVQVITSNNAAKILITDNGRGFEVDKLRQDRLGLSIMQERAAEINAKVAIKSHTGKGTTVSIKWSNNK